MVLYAYLLSNVNFEKLRKENNKENKNNNKNNKITYSMFSLSIT